MERSLDQEPADDRCWAYREFDYGAGFMHVYLLEDNRIEVYIFGIIETTYPDYSKQSFMMIDHCGNIPTYQLINIVFDKLTEDFKCFIGRHKRLDVIYCSNWFKTNHKELCNFENEENRKTEYGGDWMEFTEENCQYIKPLKEPAWVHDEMEIIIKGNIDTSGVFTYDYPVVSNQDTLEYYTITRGRHWGEVGFDKINDCYFVVPKRPKLIRPYPQHCCALQSYSVDYSDYVYYFYGCIEIYLLTDNRIYCIANNLGIKEGFKYGEYQNTFIIKYPNTISLFNVIDRSFTHIMHRLFLTSNRPNCSCCVHNNILCSDKFIEEHPGVSLADNTENVFDCNCMELNEDTLQFLDYADDIVDLSNVVYITMDVNSNFTNGE
jgi:hypothetical protein